MSTSTRRSPICCKCRSSCKCLAVALEAGTESVHFVAYEQPVVIDRSWPTPACQPTTTKQPFVILDGTYRLCIRSAGRISVPTLFPPDQWSRRQAKTAFGLIHTPHCARLQARLRAPRGHSLAILFRFFFDPLRTRPGASQGEWRGVGGRPGPGYVSNKRASEAATGPVWPRKRGGGPLIHEWF